MRVCVCVGSRVCARIPIRILMYMYINSMHILVAVTWESSSSSSSIRNQILCSPSFFFFFFCFLYFSHSLHFLFQLWNNTTNKQTSLWATFEFHSLVCPIDSTQYMRWIEPTTDNSAIIIQHHQSAVHNLFQIITHWKCVICLGFILTTQQTVETLFFFFFFFSYIWNVCEC